MTQFIVVGAGPAGCAVAATIAGTSHHQAILIESGRERPSSAESQRHWALVGDPSRRWYRGGAGLGGSSLVNAGIMGPVGSVATPMAVVSTVTPGPVGTGLLEASPEARRLLVLGADGRPVSAATALGIGSTSQGAGLTILSETTALSILFDGRRAVGVRTDRGDVLGDGVVLAAGAIATPILLLDSGVDTPGIGEGLRDHPAVMVATGDPFGSDARARPTALAPVPRPARGDPAGHLLAIDGTIDEPAHAGLGVGGGGAPGNRAAAGEADVEVGAVGDRGGAVMVGLMSSQRVGSVRRSRETGGVIVDLGPSVDAATLALLWSRARQLLDRDALAPMVRDAYVDDWGTRFDRLTGDYAQTLAWVRRAATGYFHAVGTCASAVDSDGAVFGYSGLVIADLSAVAVPPVWPMAASIGRGREVALGLVSQAPR